MEVRLGERALHRMREIYDSFYEVSGYHSAENILGRIKETYDRLAVFPYIGKREPGMENYRSIVCHHNYKIVYRVELEVVYVIDVWDCRQNPDRMKDLVAP